MIQTTYERRAPERKRLLVETLERIASICERHFTYPVCGGIQFGKKIRFSDWQYDKEIQELVFCVCEVVQRRKFWGIWPSEKRIPICLIEITRDTFSEEHPELKLLLFPRQSTSDEYKIFGLIQQNLWRFAESIGSEKFPFEKVFPKHSIEP